MASVRTFGAKKDCSIGTLPGCMLNPFLCLFYLYELIHLTEENACQGVYVNEFHPNVTMLLYADDLVIVGDHIGRVQKLLNALSEVCNEWGLQVNMSKTKSKIFRNGGIIKQNQILYFKEKKLENISYDKYVGITMSTRSSWTPAQVTLATQAGNAFNVVNHFSQKCDYSLKSACNIFDKCVVPVLKYGSEVWCTDVHKSIENVHLKFCKNSTKHKKQNTALYSFVWIWEKQDFPYLAAFIRLYSERVRDCELQLWSSDLYAMPKLKLYCKFKES